MGKVLQMYLFFSKIQNKRDDFDVDIVNIPLLDGDVSRRAAYGVLVYISQLIRFIMLRTSKREINV